jgi:lipid II:glycine glycyltransferase (peptidoglycan interpeptide bridge formation enzyme)
MKTNENKFTIDELADSVISPNSLTREERKLADEIIKAQNEGGDPIEAIRKNPNLTAEEKEAAIKSLQQMTGSGDKNKKIIIGGIVVAVIGLIAYYLYSKKSSES